MSSVKKKMIGWSVANGILEGKQRLCANYGGVSLSKLVDWGRRGLKDWTTGARFQLYGRSWTV